ncbi:MAG: SET domain-containing protein [Nitrososphaerota archaeon]
MLNENIEVRDHHKWKGQKGLYAKAFIPKGTIIGTFGDRTVESFAAEQLNFFDPEFKSHLLKFGCYYNDKWWLNLDDARFINHSCDHNVGYTDDFTDVAIKDIQKDEELTCDYSTLFHPTLQMIECNCGSERCRKIIRSYESTEKINAVS